MRIFSQAKLLLWKNIILRFRHPGILILEVIWPVLVVGLIAIMRLAVPPTKHGNCHYQPRAMPSAGAVPFLQTYLCNLDNPCYRSDQKLQAAQTTSQQFSALTQNLGPLLASDEVLDVLAVSNKTSNVYTMIRKAVGNKELLHGLEDIMNVSSYFRDPNKVKQILVDDYKLLSKPEADALLDSRINVGQLVNLTGSPDFKAVACDPTQLGSYVQFPRGANVKDISRALCNITEDQTTGLANLMIGELNFTTILNSLKVLEEVRETFTDEDNIMSYAFEIVAQMVEVVTGSDEVMKLLGTFASIPDVADLLRKIPEFVEGFQDFDSIMAVMKDIMTNVEPLMKSLQLGDSPIWLAAMDAVELSENFLMMAEGKWNGTSEEFIQPMKDLIKHIEDMAQDEEGQRFIAFFEFLTKMDWVKAYDEVIYTQTLSESTIKNMLSSLQVMFEQMSTWDTMQQGVRLSEHSLDVMAILTEKSIELRHALKDLFDSNDVIKNEIKKIFAYGPSITTSVINAFASNEIFMDIANEASYQDVCRKALTSLQTQVPPDVYNDVKNTLCLDTGDVNTAMNDVFKTLKLNDVAKVINQTVHEFENLYKGEFFKGAVQLVDLYDHYVRFTTALNNYLYDDYQWFQVFTGFYVNDIDFNQRGWEPVTDMLDENMLTTIVLASFQSIGKAFASSPLANEFAPTIHVMSEMVKMVYQTMADINVMTSMDSPIMQAAKMATKYSPEILDGVTYMLDNNMDMMFDLISSDDPLRTFCGDKYLYKMGMPSYVPVDEMNNLVCKTNWDVVVAGMSQPAQRIEAMIPKMAEIFQMEPSISYNIEADWIQVQDYSERLFDMISRGQILGVIDMRTTTVEFFGQLDFSRIDQTMASVSRLAEKMMTNDPMIAAEIAYKVLAAMPDESDGSDLSLTQIFNMGMMMFDSIMDQQIKSLKDSKSMTSGMMDIINGLPPTAKTMTILLAKAYPQFVSAAAKIMYDPTQLTDIIVAPGAKSPDCNTSFVSDYMMLPRDSDVHRFEVFLCGVNVTELFTELLTPESAGLMGGSDLIMDVINGKVNTSKAIDWRGLQDKINEYNRILIVPATSTSQGFDFSPFNMTAIDMSWERFYRAADAVSRLDQNKIIKLVEQSIEISTMIFANPDNPDDAGLGGLLYSTMFINAEFTRVLVNELSVFTNSSQVIMVDFLGSEELKKLTSLLVISPDINAVGVATLYRLISAPQKATINMDFDALCSNLTLFSQVFVVSASPMAPAKLQNTICQTISTVNMTLLFEQVMDRPSIKQLEHAMEVIESNDVDAMKVGFADQYKNTMKMTEMIEKIVMNPPNVKVTASDDVWQDAAVYARAWERLGSDLGPVLEHSLLNESSTDKWEVMVLHVAVEVLKSFPEAGQIFGFIDAFVDITQSQLDGTSDDFFETYKKYPNTAIVIELMNGATDALQTVLYTVLQDSDKLQAWTNALQSWGSFCMTSADTIFTVPRGLKFNMADFKTKMCSIDGEELVKELGQSQSSDRIESLFSNNSTIQGNATNTEKKLMHLLESFSKETTTSSGDDVANSFNLRLFNETVWEDMMERVGSWLNDTATDFMSPEKISALVASTIKDAIQGMAPNATDVLNTGLAVADVVLDELLAILNSKSLDEAFQDLPAMKPFIYLLNAVPELYEAILYTSVLHPDKISLKLIEVMSFEDFCANSPEEMFSTPPNSLFDSKKWTDTLCSINDTLLEQLMQFKTAKQIEDIINNSLKKPVNITDLMEKSEKLVNRLEAGIPLNERVFDEAVWTRVMENVNSWMQDYGSGDQIFSHIEKSLTMGIIEYIQSTPEDRETLHYIDAVLDIMGTRVGDSQVDIKDAFKGFPTIETLLQLLERAPEIIETVLYTVIAHPEKAGAWSTAMQSFATFCATPASDILVASPGSRFDVTAFLAELCTVDVEVLVTELNTYQGAERIKQISMGNDTTPVNATAVMEKMNTFFGSIENTFTDPMAGSGLDLRLLNASVWEGIGKRMEKWLDSPNSVFSSDMDIADIIGQVLTSTLSQMPESQDVFTRMLAMVNLLTDQAMDLVNTGSINSTLGNSVNMQGLVNLVNNAPEILEVLVYTAQNHPEKLSSAPDTFMTLDHLCTSSPEDIFSVPPDVTFDLKGWFSQLCALNVSAVEMELGESNIASDLDAILYGAPGSSANVTSIIAKIDHLAKLFDRDPQFHDRFLNESVWSRAMSNIQQWTNNPSAMANINAQGIVSGIFDVIDQLQREPGMKEALLPLTVMMAVVGDLMGSIVALENKTTLQGSDLFARWQGMQKMLTFIQTPGVLDVLFVSAGQQKFLSIINEDGLKDFCDPSTDPSKYLTSPPSKPVDLQTVRSAFCDVNFDDFMDGFNSFIDIKTIEKISNGSMEFDWKAFGQTMDKFLDLVSKWEKSPPTFNLPPQWMNESYWQTLLDTEMATLGDQLSTKDQITSIVKELGPLLDTEGFKQVGMILNSVMDILNGNIQSMQGKQYTLGSLIESVPALKNLFDAVGVGSDTLRSFALSPIKNADLFIQLFVSDDVHNEFCNTDKWKKAVDFPADFDTSGLFQTVCNNDIDSLLSKMQDNFNLTQTLKSLMDNSSHVQDWTEVVGKVFNLVDNLEILFNNPPTLNADETLSVLSENYNMTNIFKLTSAFSALSSMFGNHSDSNSNTIVSQTSNELENIVGMIVGVLDKILDKVKIRNGQLDIAAVFKDVPEVQRIIKGFIDMKPDPLTGLFAVALKADKITDFMSWSSSPSKLKELFCVKSNFERTFQIRPDVDVDGLLNALCTIDFDDVARKLEDSFVPSSSNFDMTKFSNNMEDIISQLTNLTNLEYVMFNGTDLGSVLMLNETRLMGLWEDSSFGDVPDDYVALTTQILNSVLNEMNNTGDIQTLSTSFKFMVAYLESFNSFLRSVKDHPIRLSMLLNNTEVGAILNPVLTNIHILDGLVDMTVDINKLTEIVDGSSPEMALCGMELFDALKIPANEMQAFQDLQTHVCNTNESVLLWQTVMVQGNGYLLHKQLEFIEREVASGQTSLNTTAVALDMEELISLMQTIIGQYVDGSRSFTDLIDTDQIKEMLEHTQKNIADRLLEASKHWSVDMADIVLPRVLDQASLTSMSKSLSTVNLFMNLTIAQLRGMNDGSIDVSDFFLKADGLQNLIEAYIRLGTSIAPAWSNKEFDADKIRQLFKDTNQVSSLCQGPEGIAQHISSSSSPSQAAQDMSTVVCSVMGATMTDDVKNAIGYNQIGDMLTSIWDVPQATPNYSVFVNNVQTFTQLVQELSSKSYTISNSLLNVFNLQDTMDSLQNIGQNPQAIFQLLKLLGLGIEAPLGQDSEAVKSLSQMNSFVLMPLVRLFEAMQDKGLTITNMADNPNTLLDLMSVLVDFDVHFAAITEFAVKPQINTLKRNRDAWCVSQDYRDTVKERLSKMTLPVAVDDVLSTICSEDSSKWIERFKEMGLTNVQMEVVLDKMMRSADLFEMYHDQFKWVDLMSSFERLSALIADSGTKAKMDDIRSAWTATKDILFDKGFTSLFSYLELINPSSQDMGTDWLVFKQFMRFLSSVMKTIDNNVKNVADADNPVQLKDALPDSQKLAEVLSRMLGSQNAAELLVTSVDPMQFYKLSLYDSWKDICDGRSSILYYFYFPDGTDVDTLTKDLCHAVTDRSTAFEELMAMFGAKDMFKQLDMLLQHQWNASNHVSVYDETHAAMMHLIHTLERVQHSVLDGGSVESYLQPVLTMLESLGQSQQTASLCNAMVTYLNKTQDYQYFHGMFSQMFAAFNLASRMADHIADMDDLACSLNDNNEISLKNFMNKLEDLGIVADIQKAVEDMANPPSQLECSAPVTFSEALMKAINTTVGGNQLDVDRMDQCVEDTTVEFRRIISSTSKLLDFIKELVGAMQMPVVQNLINDPELVSTFGFIMNAIDANSDMIVKFNDLLTNDVAASTYLTDVLTIPKMVASSIMNATVNQDWENFLTESVSEVGEILCDPSRLSKILTLPQGSGVNMTEVSRMICTNQITDTVMYLKNISSTADQIAKLSQDSNNNQLMTIVVSLTSGLADVITDFDQLIRLFGDLSTRDDIDVFEGNVDVIDDIIQGKVMERFGDSLKEIFNGVKPFFSQDPVTQAVVRDVEKVIDGIIAIQVIIEGPVIDTLEVKDLVTDVNALENYMLHQLNFTKDVTDSILTSVFSTRVLLGLDDKPSYTCDEVFDMLLLMNGTGKTPADISDAFCQLSNQELTELVNKLKMELDIGAMVAKYVSYTTDSILVSTDMTKEELNDMVVKIDRSQVVIQQATDEFKKSPNGSQILEVFSGANANAFTSMDALTPLMCGEEVKEIFNAGFTDGLVVSSSDRITQEIHKGIDHNTDDLPNEFCVGIYESVRNSEIGSIIWAYVKPIMRGKILYTPDNEVTRAIIKNANRTFETLEEVYRVSSIWAKETPNLMSMTVPLNESDSIRDALENDFIKGVLESTVGVSATNVLSGLDALQSNNFDADDLVALQTVAEIIANYTSCLELNRFVPMASEEELEMEAYRLSKNKTFWGGIVFKDTEDNTNSNNNNGRRKRQAAPDIPKHVTYKIRMDVDNVMDTDTLKSGMYKMAAEAGFVEDMRYLRGFIYIQDILDNSIIDLHKNPVMKTPGLRIRQMPFPCHHYDSFIFMLGSYLIPIMMTFVFLASIGTATNNLIYDRENGQEQTLNVMGMMSGLNFLSWFVTTMTLMGIVCAIISIMLKYTDIFIYSNTFLIFLFLLNFCFSSVMLLYMVSSFFNRTTLAILFVLMFYLISYMPYILVISLELTMEPYQKYLACLFSTTAFSFGAHNLGYLEESGEGVQWSNIDSEASKDFSVHWACLMMLIDSAIYLVIGWYVRHVKPGKYGVSQPWYFPISPSYWCGCLAKGGAGLKYLAPKHPEHSKGSLFEVAPPGYEVGIEVHNLSKKYGKKKVLHDLTIDFYEGQISCLLGHNGAAKTTALKLLCGVQEPTSGTVLLNGRTPISGKHSLGVCPQQNALFDYMTVLEHMEFYAGVKGTQITINRMMEIKKLLQDVDLWHAKNVPSGDLSYGMKRRLCVALAFVGGSRTVVLDEPTSGIDPHARKNIWNLISRNRPGRTILLSTHHLDEADILSDRMAVMHKGRLLCCGSPSFLKRQIGGGYKLTISKIGNPDISQKDYKGAQPDLDEPTTQAIDANILSYVQSMCPTARIIERMGTEMVIELPKEESLMNVSLPVFFQELHLKAKDIGIANYGLTDTKVEDIFLQLTMEMDKVDANGDRGSVNPALSLDGESSVALSESLSESTDTESRQKENAEDLCSTYYGSSLSRKSMSFCKDMDNHRNETQQSVDTSRRCSGASLIWAHIVALLIKRFHHYRRNWRILMTCFLLPLIAFLIALGFSSIRPDESDQRPLVLDPVIYGKNTYTFLKQTARTSAKAISLTKTFRESPIGVGTSCMANVDQAHRIVQPSCQNGSAPYTFEKPLYVIGCKEARQDYHEIQGQKMLVEQQKIPNDLYLQNLDNYNLPNYILRSFKDYRDKRFGGWSLEDSFEEDNTAEYDPYAWFNSKGYHAMPSFFSGLTNSILRANLPPYENPEEYGITTINHPIKLGRSALTLKTLENDAADAGISIMVVIAFSFIPCGFVLYVINERVHKEKQLQQISGVGTLMYWTVSWVWDMFVYLISVGIAVGIVCIFETDSFYIRDNLAAFAVLLILYGWAMIPYIYLVSRFFKSASTAYLVTFCINLFLAMATVVSLLVMQLFREDELIWRIYKVCRHAYLIFPQFALGQGLMDMVSATVKYKLFLRFDEDMYDDPFIKEITGWKLIAMAIFGFVFFILNLIAEKIHARALSISDGHSETSSDIDEDVAREKDRIHHSPKTDLLLVNNLSKVYRRGWKKFPAVDHISFGVQEGESFGLLGVNGAGKTTTFRMLTGDLGSSGGTVMFNGKRISSHDRHFGQSVGYCPQEGGLDEYLTASETLHFHARLRGFDGTQSKELVDQLLTKLGLKLYANKAVHTYSGGTKRKLALAVAMLGDPPILYLDEPTTGMDAATRRQAWKCIGQANRNGQSVILTSHTMDECDALCSRIAIMVNGQIKCIGSPQHLKNRFGDGYTAIVHSQKDNLGAVSHFFLNQFPGAVIRTKHNSSLEIMIPISCGILADILTVLQKSQQEEIIEYYSLSQTTLDSVFVSFAQEQTDTFEEGTVTNSSSIEDKSFTPRSSVSSDPPSYDNVPLGKKDSSSPYVFSNPQFVVTEDENESRDNQPRQRYVSNITLTADMAPVPKSSNEENILPSTPKSDKAENIPPPTPKSDKAENIPPPTPKKDKAENIPPPTPNSPDTDIPTPKSDDEAGISISTRF